MATVRPFRALRPAPEQRRAGFRGSLRRGLDRRGAAARRGEPALVPPRLAPRDRSARRAPTRTPTRSTRVARENFETLERDGAARRGAGRRRSTSTASAWATTSRPAWRLRARSTSTTGRHPQARAHAQGQGGRPHPAHDRARRADRPGLPDVPRRARDRRARRARRPRDAPLFDFTAPDGVRHTVWRIAAGCAARASTDAFRRRPAALHRRRPPPRRERQPRARSSCRERTRAHGGAGAVQLLPGRRVPREPGPHPALQPRRQAT